MITEALWMILIAAAFAFGGYEIGAWRGWQRGWDAGHEAGRSEERCLTNARVIRGKLCAFKDGVVVGLKRAVTGRN